MAFSMATYLSTGVADYTATELSVKPQEILPVIPVKNQLMFWTDAETPLVVNVDDDTTFTIELIFKYITKTETETIMNFWTLDTMANGKVNSFYWVHPTDSETYVAKFISVPIQKEYPGIVDFQGVTSIKLFIDAVKA